MKKTFIFILIAAILISLGVIGYLIFNQQKSGPTEQSTGLFNLFPLAGKQEPHETEISQDNQSGINQTNNEPDSTTNLNLQQIKVGGLKVILVNGTQQTFFIDQKTGHLHTLDNQNNLKRLTNFTWPGVDRVYWGQSADAWQIVMQRENGLKIETILNSLKITGLSEISDAENLTPVKTIPWLFDHSSLAVSPDGRRFVYLTKQTNGAGIIYLNDWILTKPVKIWESLLADWELSWPTEKAILVVDRPAYDYPGSAYLINLETKQVKRIISQINGLTAKLSPDGKNFIYAKSSLFGFGLYQYEVETEKSAPLDLKTLPEKCVWGKSGLLYCAVPQTIPSGNYPDDWYQSKVSFKDNLWLIDLSQKITRQIHQPKGMYDLTSLAVNEETGWLYAINKRDQTLQTFSLNP
ncbi:MAG: hypothetical protein COV08_03685 [Candidatus Vogelbacteria bacterium CG10_big_fil_rev_8_21_14_0_10_49_38]|uniref:Dipeptidylpeptidase IV N-terminal domain-containing protein n=1 Tax=Candidatus Vogelbacteria bacterium CG10_big_fil_rev_8_21_14_0_10_49_38 TaxID=1975043 RepID=A0A2H0RH11_9BACT|nr:MAG: hypothetical protein BK006_03675 [bacterium CG10_49_38]PIR45737.1 MAG: hypothetical protein COV08_03685 [Candidatus Vogelbacteria bacterium CG10_big_fil_rev_8_21_14_0_10_49_38]